MSINSLSLNREQLLLLIFTVVMGFVVVACMALGGVTGSSSLFFDGVSTMVATLISGVMFLVATLIVKGNSQRFQFGYWHFEPLIILFECGFLLLAASFALWRGFELLTHGGNQLPLGSVRKVGAGRIAAMIGWRPTWQGATNSRMRAGS
ncbi:cation transporter [Pseudomonas chlororaphis]|uniref:cation transporter n=1 Tax=Pseudomonas chlororaphis TaxID=587753 RepID=UPI000F580A11|nr:cation transporter [Pseudomonas chlororaphis]